MDSSRQKIRSKGIINRRGKGMLMLCLGFLLLIQNVFATQITASAMEPSLHKRQRLISVHFVNEPLEDVLHKLARKVKVGLSYKTEAVSDKMVTFQAKRASIYTVLDSVLAGTRLYATLSQSRKVIFIKKKSIQNAVQQSTITGTVTDAGTGEVLPGVNILVIGTTTGTTTDANGKYELAVESLQDTLRFSFIGYQKQELPIAGRSTVDVALKAALVGLDQIIVTGTAGGARKRELGTSVSSIDTKDLESEPVSNIGSLLRGKTSGIQSLATTGQVGGGGTLKLRGVTSISQGNYPLIFVNGVRLSTQRVPPPNLEDGRGARQSPTPLNFINPDDVARIEVIKGAAATTLYGSEASSGVIQIFTHRGEKSGETHGSFSVTEGANFWPQLGNAITSHPTDLDIDKIRKTGLAQKYNVSVTGGTDNINYFISGSYSNEDGIVSTQGSKGWTGTGNFTFHILDNLKVSTNTTFGKQNTRYVPDSNNRHGYLLNTMRLDKGYNPGSRDNSWVLETELRGIVENYIVGVNIEHQIGAPETNSFKSNIRFGFNEFDVHNRGVLPFGYLLRPEGTIGSERWKDNLVTAEYIGNWQKRISSSVHSTFSFGGQFFNELTLDQKGGGIGFSSPGNPTISSAARTHSSEDKLREINGGLFIQEKVGINDLLYFIGGLRADGNSSFGKNYGYEFYPKGSVSYVISDENFWNVNWWNSLRLRGAIGYAGKAPGAFDAVRTYTPISGLDGQPAVTPARLGNPDLGPERTREFEFGIDADFFDSRISLNLTYYNDLTTNALVPVHPIPSTGYTNTQLENVGDLSSKGIELASSFIPVRNSSFLWSIGFDLTTINENVEKLGGSPISEGYEQYIKEGYAPPSVFGRKVTNPNAHADPIFKNNAYLGKTFPDLSMIFKTNVQIGKYFSINARGELSKGGHIVSGTAYLNTVRGYWPPTQKLQNKRKNEGIESLTASERAKLSPYYGYDQFVYSSDFFKLRTLGINYEIPSKWVPNGISNIRLSLMGKNLLKISNYPGLDPEVTDGSSSGTDLFQRHSYYTLPPRRSIAFKLYVEL